MAVVVGVALVAVGAVLVRWRAAVADWQLEARVQEIRRRRLSNEEYVDREVRALTTSDQHRLQRWIVAVFGLFLVFCGAYAIVKGLGIA